jgi:hypothetical protein|tara:strand:- start:410 stop:700 length:291 start_codon:yes stop_codon:yes gene_type:complete
MKNPEHFLDGVLGRLFPAPRKPKPKQNPAYGRLYRWCRQNGITYERDMSYWDFDDRRIGTICLGDGIRDRFAYDDILELVQKRIATGDPEATLHNE